MRSEIAALNGTEPIASQVHWVMMWSILRRQVFNSSKFVGDTLIRVLKAKLSFLLFEKTQAHLTNLVISRCLFTNHLMVKTRVCHRPLAQQSMSALDSKSKHP